MKRSIDRLISLLIVGVLVCPLGLFVSSAGMSVNIVKLSGNGDMREKKHFIYFYKSDPLGESHVYPGDKIQDAVDNASAGDIIYVHDDDGNPYTYHGNVVVNKSDLTLIGDGMDTVTVNAKNAEDHTSRLTEDGITMTGFTVMGSYSCGYGGICIEGADNCEICNCNCRDNLCAGIFLKSSYNCEITDNIVSDGDGGGIKIESSDHNVIKNNIVEHNPVVGLALYQGSSDNLVYNNYFNDNGELGGGNVIDNVLWENTWNTSKTPGPNIIGGPYLGGNYYDDYTGIDDDGDGLGDIPYEIINYPQGEVTNRDYLPLAEWVPQLSYFPTSYDFGNKQAGWMGSTTFEIWNSGSGTLTYSLSESCGWVDVFPTSGDSTGEHDTITAKLNTTSLSSGDHTCNIYISSNDGSRTFTTTVTIIEDEKSILSYNPYSYDFGNMSESKTDSTTFEIWNSGSGTLTYSLSESCGWVDVFPTSGDSTGEHDTITVSIDTTGLTPGSHNCLISITSNGGSGTFTVAVTVVEESEEPVLSYNPHSHDFGDIGENQTDSTTFKMWNSGTGTLEYSLSESCSWVDISPTNGDSTGEHDTITVKVNTTGLDIDDYTCPISITSNDGSGTFTVTVTVVEESEKPVLSYNPHYHDFGDIGENQTDSTTFKMWNSGTGTLEYSLSESCSWVDISPTNGDSTGEHDTITVKVNTTGLSLGSHSCAISISSDSCNTTFTVNVTIVGDEEGTILSYTPHSYNFGSINEDQTDIIFFEIWNSGNGTLTYTLSETCSWVDISPTNGDSTGERDTVTVYVDTTGLKNGSYTCDISISSNGGDGTYTITLDIQAESEKTPGFQAVIAIAGLLLVTTIIFFRKKRGGK